MPPITILFVLLINILPYQRQMSIVYMTLITYYGQIFIIAFFLYYSWPSAF